MIRRAVKLWLMAAAIVGFMGVWAAVPVPAVGQTSIAQEQELTESEELSLAEASQLNQQAWKFYQQGKYSEAIPLAERALAIRQQVLGEEHPDVATSLNNLALLYQSQGRYAEAEPLYLQALEMRKQLLGEEHPYVANSLNNLALLYENQGRYAEAEQKHLQALELYKRLLGEEHPHVATSLNNLALLYQSQGRYAEAEQKYLQALEMRKRLLGEEHPDVAVSLNNLAALYDSQGRYAKAEQKYLQALEMIKRLLGEEHPHVAVSLNNLALLYQSQGRYAEAEPLLVQALEMTKRLLGEEHLHVAASLNNLALLYQSQGRYAEAEQKYLQALEMAKRLLGEEHPHVATSLNNLAGLYYSQGKITRTLDFLEQGLEVEERNLNYNLVAGAEQQKQDYIDTISGTTDEVISLHLKEASDNERAARLALTTILRRKGRLLDFLTNSQFLLRQNLDPQSQKLLDRLNATRTQLANLIYNRPPNLSLDQYREKVATLDNQAKQLEGKISRRSSEFRTATQPVTVETIQKLIPPNAALVELVQYRPFNPKAESSKRFGRPRYAAYVLHAQGEPQGIDLGEVDTFEQALLEFRLALQDRNTPTDQFKQTARRVDEKLMQPVRQLLGTTRTVLLSPDSNLNTIPFEALVDENNRYLVENYALTYLTSGRDLLRFANQPPSQTDPVLLGNPNFNRPGERIALQPESDIPTARTSRLSNPSQWELSPIPGTAEEVKAIAALLGVEPLLDSRATEEAVKQVNRPRVLHIATHGFFESVTTEEESTLSENPLLLSGLVLAGFKVGGSGRDDGVLTALEATGLKLYGTKLVVLSACDTGLGDISKGEGIYGLRRAFVIAGSESQLISLWKVDDRATKELMVAYYQRLKNNSGRTEALRQTQLEMLQGQKYQHPYYWASFIPSGNWLPMDLGAFRD